MKELNIEEVKKYIKNSSSETKIYIGSDSETFKRQGEWYAHYTVAIVIRKDGKHGCKIFGEIVEERIYDSKKDKPSLRLMSECYKAVDFYLKIQDSLENRHCEVHLDINPDLSFGSSCVIQQAIGYVKGICNLTPQVKPDAFAASCASDRFKDIGKFQK